MKKIYNIVGMSCTNCSSSIQDKFEKTNGVNKINVNFASNSMSLDFDENILNEKEILSIIKNLGFKAKEAKNTKNEDLEIFLKKKKKELFISLIFMLLLFYIAMGPMIHLPIFNFLKGHQNSFKFAFTQMILCIPILILHRDYIIKGFNNLIKRKPNMDSLVFIGSMTAFLYGIYIVIMLFIAVNKGDMALIDKYHMSLYFESSAGILFFISLGKYLESKSKKNTSNSVKSLLNLIPDKALKVLNESQDVTEIALDEVNIGDIILVKPGMKVPVDGIIIKGESAIDESFLTGESIPSFKKTEDKVFSSSINLNGTILVKCEQENKDSMINKIIALVEEASNSKAPMSRIADRISRYFVPIILLLSIMTLALWFILQKDLSFSIDRAISVLVISCPCALGLATPLSIMRGTKLLVDNHILVKSGEAVETICKIDSIVLDKTGTITKGFPEVVRVIELKEKREKIIQIAYSLEANSAHPLAYSIIKKANEEKLDKLFTTNFINYDGKGISANIENSTYFVGNTALMTDKNIDLSSITNEVNTYMSQDNTLIFIAKEKEVLGFILIKDDLKETSLEAIKILNDLNYNLVLLSGDNKKTVESLAKTVNIKNFYAEVLPIDKEKVIKGLQKQGKKVMMIGDGINDSLSLITSDVGISFKNGSDIAIDSSDFILIKNDLLDVVTAIKICRKIIKNIKFNFFWAFIYNIIFIPIAMGALYRFDILLNPMFASIAMSLSSLCVVFNSLMLNYKKGDF